MLTEEEEDDFRSTVDECNEDDDNIGEDQKTRLTVEEAKEDGNNSEVDATLRDGDSRLSFFHHPPLSDRRPCGKLSDPLGRTLLHYAAYAGRLETCQLLLTHSLCQADAASVDDVHGWTAVHYAASQVRPPVRRSISDHLECFTLIRFITTILYLSTNAPV